MGRIKSLTLTVITESQVALSNDQGTGGNYTPVKKMFYKDGIHLFTSVSTFTYELRRILKQEFGWNLFDIILNTGDKKDKGDKEDKDEDKDKDKKKKKDKVKNVYNMQLEETNREADLFGYLIPKEQVSRTSPLRIIPPVSLNKFHSDTQLITNRGFLNPEFERKYYGNDGNEWTSDIPRTQTLASEEIMGDYYQYTVTLELDRIGRIETETIMDKDKKTAKFLEPSEYKFKEEKERKNIVIDFIEALKILTRQIKHQTVHLSPLAVFGGLFFRVVPYFATSVVYKNNKLYLEHIKQTIDDYYLEKESFLLKAVNSKIETVPVEDFKIGSTPVADLNRLITCIKDDVKFNEKNEWIL